MAARRPISFIGLASSAFILASCSPDGGTTTASASKPAVPKGKPAHVRFMNLTSSEVSCDIDHMYPVTGLQPNTLSGGYPVSPLKTYTIHAMVDGKEFSLKQPTEPAKFSTIIVTKTGLKGFVSGESLSIPGGAAVDFVNFTKKPLVFKLGGNPTTVKPSDSQTVNAQIGGVTVGATGSNNIDLTIKNSEVWGVYAFEDHGKVVLSSVSLKGSGQAAAAGGASGS